MSCYGEKIFKTKEKRYLGEDGKKHYVIYSLYEKENGTYYYREVHKKGLCETVREEHAKDLSQEEAQKKLEEIKKIGVWVSPGYYHLMPEWIKKIWK